MKKNIIAFSSIFLGELNAAWWRYFMIVAFNVMAYALYAMCLVCLVSAFVDAVLHSLSDNIHDLVCSSPPPFH